jgi:hypothetical protein
MGVLISTTETTAYGVYRVADIMREDLTMKEAMAVRQRKVSVRQEEEIAELRKELMVAKEKDRVEAENVRADSIEFAQVKSELECVKEQERVRSGEVAKLTIELQRVKEKANGESDQLKEVRLGYEKEIAELRKMLQRGEEVNRQQSEKMFALRADHKVLRVHLQDEGGSLV